MNDELKQWLISVEKIDMKTYHKMIDLYTKGVVDAQISELIRQSVSSQFEYEILLPIWEKYGYYLATCDKNDFFDDFIQIFEQHNNRQKEIKENEKSYNEGLLSVFEEVYYGFHLLNRKYIQIFEKGEEDDFITLDLFKIFSSIQNLDDAEYLIDCFSSFYQKCNRMSNFDKKFKTILFEYQKEILNGILPSYEDIGIVEKQKCELLSSAELREQILMYISYSEAFYQFQLHNLKLVQAFVEKKFGYWNFEDLFQSGVLGLDHAIRKYDVRRGVYFSSYSYFWIQKYVFDSAYLDFNSLSVSRNDVAIQNKAMKISNDYFSLNGEKISVEKMAKKLGKKSKKKVPYFQDRSNIICQSLDVVTKIHNSSSGNIGGSSDSDEGLSLLNVLEDKKVNIEKEAIFSYDFQLLLDYMDEVLSEREKDILLKRAGYQIDEPMTLRRIASEYGVTGETVRTVEMKAIQKLTKTKKGRSFSPYL